MATVSVSRVIAAPAGAVEALWFDTTRWAEWVDGLEAVTRRDPGWPVEPGARVTWRSGPAGRGTVTEEVREHGSGSGQRVAISDASVDGEQTIAFAPDAAGLRVTLTLTYRVRRRTPLTAIIDLLFVRRAMSESLARTLTRFDAAASASSAPG